MPDQPSSDLAPGLPSLIDRLNRDILRLIFQEVIDEEADQLIKQNWIHGDYFPQAAPRLAQVCKNWKEILYSTPVLWTFIHVRMTKSLDGQQSKLQRLARRSKNAGVDLYLIDLHFEDQISFSASYNPHDPNCCCKGKVIRVDLTCILQVRRLHIAARTSANLEMLTPSLLRLCSNIKLLNLRFALEDHTPYSLPGLLSYLGRLTTLRIHPMKAYNLPTASSDTVLLPELRTLVLSKYFFHSDCLPEVARFLSHAPHIEVLELWGFINAYVPSEPLPILCLSYLRRLHVSHFSPIDWLFSEGRIQTPQLIEFDLEQERNAGDGFSFFEEATPELRDERIRSFFALHPSIHQLRVSMSHPKQLSIEPYDSSSVENLSLQRGREGSTLAFIPWHSDLINPSERLSTFLFPNLKVLTISILWRTPTTGSVFDELVRARCLPIDKDGNTVAGCKAIDALRVNFQYSKNCDKLLLDSETIKTAEIRELTERLCELRWSYRPSPIL